MTREAPSGARRWRSLRWQRFWCSPAGRAARAALLAVAALLVLGQLAGCVPAYGRARYGYGYGYGGGYGYGYAPYSSTYYDPYGPAYYDPYGPAYQYPYRRGYPAGRSVSPNPRVIVAPPAYRAPVYRGAGGSGVIITPQGRGPVYGPR